MGASRIFTFDDPHQYGATIRAATVDVFPTAKGKFHADIVQVALDRLWLQRLRERLPRICQGTVNASRLAIEFPIGDQPATKHSGVAVSPGEIVVNDLIFNHRRSFAPSHFGTMSLAHTDVAVLGQTLAGCELKAPSVTQVFRPAPAVIASLLTLHQTAAQLAITSPEKLAHPEIARSLEQGLIHAFIRCLADAMGGEVHASSPHHSTVLERFEELLKANSDRSLYLAEICAATGVSERTLRTYCHEHLGMGPVHYLWLRRMHLAQAALLRADPAIATVTGIAADYGFFEFGRFSVEYRALFGELPSASLHPPPVDRRTSQNRPMDLSASDFA